MNLNSITLSPEQIKAFNKLKSAYKACEKAGILFVNNYGSLEAYNSELVAEYADDSTLNEDCEDVFPADEVRTSYSFKSPDSWADDRHLIQLTDKGMRLINQDPTPRRRRQPPRASAAHPRARSP
jgi:hypothetical protein